MAKSDKLQKEGVSAFRAGDYETALEKFEAALTAASEDNTPQKRAEILNDLGVTRKQLEDVEGAFRDLETARTEFTTLGDKKGEAQALGNLAMVYEASEDYDAAVQHYLDSAALLEELGEGEMAMYSWQALSRLRMRQKEWLAAIAAYEEGIAHLPDHSIKKKVVQQMLKIPGKLLK